MQDLRDNRRFRRTTSPQGWTAVGHWVGIFVQVCLKPTSHSSDEQQSRLTAAGHNGLRALLFACPACIGAKERDREGL